MLIKDNSVRTKLIKILEDVEYNITFGYYPRKIVNSYYIHHNLMVTVGDSIFYYAGDDKYYYFYIWLMVYI